LPLGPLFLDIALILDIKRDRLFAEVPEEASKEKHNPDTVDNLHFVDGLVLNPTNIVIADTKTNKTKTWKCRFQTTAHALGKLRHHPLMPDYLSEDIHGQHDADQKQTSIFKAFQPTRCHPVYRKFVGCFVSALQHREKSDHQ